MGRPKALLQYGGETFLGRLQRIFLQHCEPVVVVLGHDAEVVGAAVDSRVRVAVNAEPERGMLTSLQAGLQQLGGSWPDLAYIQGDLLNCHP